MAFASPYLLSCHQVHLVPYRAPRNGTNRVDLDARTKSYALGYFLWATHTADCRDGIESIRISKDALDSIVQVFVGAFFSTRHVQVQCMRPHLNVARLEQGDSVRLQGVYFDSGSSRLQKDSYLLLDELVEYMLYNPQVRIKVTGHTDLVGSDQANVRLSLDRAGTIEDYLKSMGIGGDRIETAGKGMKQPVIHLTDEDSNAINRRVEVVLLRGNQNRPPWKEYEKAPKENGYRESTIEMLDGTSLKGQVIDQSGEQVIVKVHGQLQVIKKSKIRKINY